MRTAWLYISYDGMLGAMIVIGRELWGFTYMLGSVKEALLGGLCFAKILVWVEYAICEGKG